jgi:hypothetical protein
MIFMVDISGGVFSGKGDSGSLTRHMSNFSAASGGLQDALLGLNRRNALLDLKRRKRGIVDGDQ